MSRKVLRDRDRGHEDEDEGGHEGTEDEGAQGEAGAQEGGDSNRDEEEDEGSDSDSDDDVEEEEDDDGDGRGGTVALGQSALSQARHSKAINDVNDDKDHRKAVHARQKLPGQLARGNPVHILDHPFPTTSRITATDSHERVSLIAPARYRLKVGTDELRATVVEASAEGDSTGTPPLEHAVSTERRRQSSSQRNHRVHAYAHAVDLVAGEGQLVAASGTEGVVSFRGSLLDNRKTSAHSTSHDKTPWVVLGAGLGISAALLLAVVVYYLHKHRHKRIRQAQPCRTACSTALPLIRTCSKASQLTERTSSSSPASDKQ